jgi:N-acetylglutamate synthase-like GNAT family acetyltransferase
MADYTIRAATEADAETIKRMVRSAPLDPNAVDWHYFLVLEIVEDDKPKIVCIGMVHPEGNVQEVDSVVTLKEYRKRGYAEAVVHALIERAGKPIYLLAEPALIPYYEKFGFHVMGANEAPSVMTEQANWVNDFLGGRVIYSVMGLV